MLFGECIQMRALPVESSQAPLRRSATRCEMRRVTVAENVALAIEMAHNVGRIPPICSIHSAVRYLVYKSHQPSSQLNEEQHEVGGLTSPERRFDGEEVDADQYCHCGSSEFQVVV
jgi:hypothetical protein